MDNENIIELNGELYRVVGEPSDVDYHVGTDPTPNELCASDEIYDIDDYEYKQNGY